jgi:hypothetical protein
MYIYLVTVLALFAGGFFIFVMATGIQGIQEAFNPSLEESSWMDAGHFSAFNLAANFVTNIWLLFPAILLFGVAYWTYVYAQRQSSGGL